MENRVVFFSSMCLLDSTSGAAISVRSFLEAVAKSGICCESFTASLFDANRNLDLRPVLGPRVTDPKALGKRFIVERAGVKHSVFLAANTQSRYFSVEEQQRFESSWRSWLEKNRPKVVVTYGGSPFTLRMQDHARRLGARVVFYLANAEYDNADFHKHGDVVITPSEFLRDHYRETLGIDARVLRTIMHEGRLDTDTINDPGELDLRRRKGFVTFMTPIPHKGLTLFDAIARKAVTRMPDLKFLVTEGRSSREWLSRQGIDLTQRPNIWFMSNHEDVRSIYERTSVLLMPSFWKEGLGRSILEAQLSGIPVLANDRGGIAEALNGGGHLFDPPANCLDNLMARPDGDIVNRWCETIAELLSDEVVYRSTSLKALEAARPFHPDVTEKKAVAFFRELVDG